MFIDHRIDIVRCFDRAACDAAYLALADAKGELLVTGDLRLDQEVRDHLGRVRWVGDAPCVDLG